MNRQFDPFTLTFDQISGVLLTL